MRKYLLLINFLLVSSFIFSQDFSNKGKDFWVGYGYHQVMTNGGNLQDMVLYFATDQLTNITISIPGSGYTQNLTSSAVPGVLTSAPIPKTGTNDARLFAEGLSNKGIHVTSDKPMVAYAHVYNSSVSGATILFPTNTLGKEYYSVNYKNWSNSINSNCWFYVVAADTGTTSIEITPTGATTLGWVAGSTYSVNLTQGQVYNVMGAMINNVANCNPACTGYDLTGSKIRSISSANGTCKKIAVFSGSGRISLTCNNSSSSSDNYMVQSLPKTAWGQKYLTAPAAGNQAFNFYRICVLDPTTVVKVDGAVTGLPLQSNFYYEISATNQPHMIEADKPIMVAQYFTSQSACGNGTPGDPEVIYLTSVEQNINTVGWNATPNFSISAHYFNAVVPNAGTGLSSFTLDGTPLIGFVTHPQDPNYSFIRKQLSGPGYHIIKSDSGFNAIAYGFGNAESYGYNAGTNVRDLYQQIGVSTGYGIDGTPTVCPGTPFKFKVSLPYQPDSMLWNFQNAAGMQPNNNNALVSNPVPDSITMINGKNIYWYSLATQYYFTTIGTYPITITTYVPNADCGTSNDIDFNLNVVASPIVNFTTSGSGCYAEQVQFTDATNSVSPTYIWWWDFGDGTSSNIKNPTHLYGAPGTYNVRHSTITTAGCLGDTISVPITILPKPTATISGSINVCNNAPPPTITFSALGGTSPYTFSYHINGGPIQTITTSVGNTATISVPTNISGTFVYTLDSIQNLGSALCNQAQTGSATVIVGPIISATISGATNVCLNASNPLITFTGTGGIAPFTFTYNINGGANQTVTTTVGNTATISVPTNVIGTFTYNLVGVIDASGSNCTQNTTGNVTVIVNPLPTATISGNTSVCLNATQPTITFTGASASSLPYTFTYNINGGANQTITTTSGNSIAISVPTNIAGTFKYNLISVQDGSTTACTQLQSGSATVIVFPLPTVAFANTSPICDTRLISFTDNSIANAGTVTGWNWDYGDPVSGAANNSALQNPTHVFSGSGVYTITLNIITSNGCANVVPFTKTITVNNRPLAGYIIPEVCLSDTYAQFTDTSKVAGGTITGWNWNFGDPNATVPNPNTSILKNPQHSYTAVGVYLVKLIATSNLGCKDTITQTLMINGSFPVANFTVNNATALCSSDSVYIVNNSTVFPGSITKVEIYWDNINFPAVLQLDDFPIPGKVYSHKYANFQAPLTKTFTIRFRAYSGGVCVNDKILTITVNAVPKVQFTPMPDACYDATPFQITQAKEIGGVPGTFIFSGAGVSPTGIFSPKVAGIGLHTIKYVYTSSAAGCVDSITQVIKVLDTASANFSFASPTCVGSNTLFTDLSTSPNGVILGNTIWDFGDGSLLQNHAPGATFPHLFLTANTFTVKMYNTSVYGCKSSVTSQQVVVSPIPQSAFAFGETSVCLPTAFVSFINNSTISDGTANQLTYLWNFGDIASGALNNSVAKTPPSHLYNSVGPYTVKLSVTSNAGCANNFSLPINFIHPQPKAAFTINKNSICIGDSVSFIDASNGLDGTVNKWFWDMGDGKTRTTQQVSSYIYSNPQTYTIMLSVINSNGCKSDTAAKQFTVYPYPIIDTGASRFVFEAGTIVLNPTITGNGLQYLWSPITYLDSTTIAAPTALNVLDDITYTITATGDGNCATTKTLFLKVLKAPKVPNTFTPNNDGINDTWVIQSLSSYPNCKVLVFTRTGQKVFESIGYKTPWDGIYNGKKLPFDTYYYIIEPGNGRKPLTGYVTIIR